ncbi:MAG: acyl-CoA thioesterase [Anaerolineae bacterium]|nr:acyl-CoA thioesterase [Anaerolineae bacterium]
MEPKTFILHHLVKSEDLNHHGTLYAGRTAEWFVEAGFVAAASLTSPENVVCLKIHGMKFTSPIRCGELVRIESKVIFTGRSRMISFIRVVAHDTHVVEGFITFVHVDLDGKAIPHHIEITPVSEEDKALFQEAQQI